ncbi:Carbamoyl-phosphate synthase small chain [Hondaea fermentalgiana]|uniref:Carbamoyl phosphate synthase arginine-specific large chain n=1 Tax=Hondaea fermentalgiana TaxID=2315210 RepID=A0A2R5GV76_9STRA|nr:Carbamoyl-phosphate synthase small chain [Hondaea fermentalgiana]|eukprot:GBG32301.1 Carbamoyl-phosphate synthase small chain [Hondaea fermentalgiana]
MWSVKSARSVAASKAAVRQLSSSASKGTSDLSKPAAARGFVGSSMGSGGVRTATLALEDGSRFTAMSFGHEESVAGEVVFNTAMVGYPEALTDPSYRGQILVSTYPLVGNYGVPDKGVVDEFGLPKHFESDQIHAGGFLVSDYSHHFSNWESGRSLSSWLREEKVPGLYGIDTRLLTKKIREHGSMKGKIEFEPAYKPPGHSEIEFVDVNARNLIQEVSCTDRIVYGAGNPVKLLALDCGIKNNIIRNLVRRGVELHRVPHDFPFAEHVHEFDGLFLSNGPGDPIMATEAVANLRKVLESGFDKPIFGICMGNQLTALAAGAETYKMSFGNRGVNQPVLNLRTGQCFITPQNHGYAIRTETLSEDWEPLFVNRNDGTNEGIMHKTKPYFTAQFHPEAKGGPTDTEFLFDDFVNMVRDGKSSVGAVFDARKVPDTRVEAKKVLLLGSGGLSIGQAGEFDYSGNQAIKSLKEEGIETVLMNPNIASVQTNLEGANQADTVYFLPVTMDFVEEVIAREKPDGLILSMGGQTALNVGVELYEKGILSKYDVKVMGTSVESIIATEDRGIFSDKLNEINEKLAPSFAVNSIDDAVVAAHKVGFPCMIRSAFALGGLGSGICKDEAHLREMARKAFSTSPQILVEKSMLGWKEVEYEVVRDAADNCITVCNMENFDPLGIHTGDSIVVAPSQTLSNHDYQMLRDTAIKTVKHLGIIGECNIQYALDPHSDDYAIIEVNPRLSRSSALASKATGYPLAFVAAKLSLGIQLPDITNQVTKRTTACFEPSLDYVVTKIPRWDMTKFDLVSRKIGSAMKSVGEVMGIGRSWEESLQKAMRMVDPSIEGFQPHKHMYLPPSSEAELIEELEQPSDVRPYAIAHAMMDRGWSVDRVNQHTAIDTWFLHKLQRLCQLDQLMTEAGSLDRLNSTLLLQAKKSGFSDRQIAERINSEELLVRDRRKMFGIVPVVKQIDTVAGEAPAATNYLYTTYNGDESDVSFDDHGTMVLGSGVYRIGSSVEFDWCSVSAIRTLRKLGKKSVMVNYNPETVSTDFDECDKLYFEELSLERVLDIYELEGCEQAIVSVGGQLPNNIALQMHNYGTQIAGTSPLMIDSAEDRDKFSSVCDKFDIDQPSWSRLTTPEDAFDFADKVGYPVLVRPSYVLSGAAMSVAYNAAELSKNLQRAGEVSRDHPVVLTAFIENAREIDVDAVARDGEVIAHAISEHVENAGVHSGDAHLMLPPQTLSEEVLEKCRETTRRIAKAFNITGPFNQQLIASPDGSVKIIEANIRASRSFPFSSKTVGADFIEIATTAMVGAGEPDWLASKDLGLGGKGATPTTYVGTKVPQFSFKRLAGADPKLGVEMASTGEVACYGKDVHEAFLKSTLSTLAYTLPERKNILVSIQDRLQEDFKPSLRNLVEAGYTIFATEKTARFCEANDIPVTELHWEESGQVPCLDTFVQEGEVDQVWMFSNNESLRTETNYKVRRLAIDYGTQLVTNAQVAAMLSECYLKIEKGELNMEPLTLKEYYEAEAQARGL